MGSELTSKFRLINFSRMNGLAPVPAEASHSHSSLLLNVPHGGEAKVRAHGIERCETERLRSNPQK